MTTRPATAADLPLLREMLRAAATWAGGDLEPARLDADPHLARYVRRWPAPGDLGVVAVVDGAPVGAAWLTHLTAEEPGYGYVRDGVPELSMGVRATHRGRGVGPALLADLLAAATAAGVPAVSLSVEDGNDRARRLYERHGFTVVARSGGSDVMLRGA